MDAVDLAADLACLELRQSELWAPLNAHRDWLQQAAANLRCEPLLNNKTVLTLIIQHCPTAMFANKCMYNVLNPEEKIALMLQKHTARYYLYMWSYPTQPFGVLNVSHYQGLIEQLLGRPSLTKLNRQMLANFAHRCVKLYLLTEERLLKWLEQTYNVSEHATCTYDDETDHGVLKEARTHEQLDQLLRSNRLPESRHNSIHWVVHYWESDVSLGELAREFLGQGKCELVHKLAAHGLHSFMPHLANVDLHDHISPEAVDWMIAEDGDWFSATAFRDLLDMVRQAGESEMDATGSMDVCWYAAQERGVLEECVGIISNYYCHCADFPRELLTRFSDCLKCYLRWHQEDDEAVVAMLLRKGHPDLFCDAVQVAHAVQVGLGLEQPMQFLDEWKTWLRREVAHNTHA